MEWVDKEALEAIRVIADIETRLYEVEEFGRCIHSEIVNIPQYWRQEA